MHQSRNSARISLRISGFLMTPSFGRRFWPASNCGLMRTMIGLWLLWRSFLKCGRTMVREM